MDLGSLLGGPKHVQKTPPKPRKPGPNYLVRYVRDGSSTLQNDEPPPEMAKAQDPKQEPPKAQPRGKPESKQKETESKGPALTEPQMVEDIAKKLEALQRGANNEAAIAQCDILIDFVKKAPRHKAARVQKALVDAGCVDSLLNMVSVYGHFNDTVRASTLRAMAILCYTHELNRNFLTSRGVVELALSFVHPTKASLDDGVRRNALALLNNLAGSSGAHEHILANDGASAIISRVSNNELEVVAQQGIALLRNLAFHEHSREPLVKAGAVPALVSAIQRWKLDPESFAAMDISMSVACLVGHEENNPHVKADARTIAVIIKHFDLTLRDACNGKSSYVVWKMCMSISKLAVNDANKAMIGQLGGVPLLYKAMIWDPPAGIDDDYELRMVYAITSIWNLAFLPENQVLIKAIPELLVKLEEQRWVVAKAIRSAASGALFVLGLRGQESQPQEKPQHGPHVMLSYCWAEQELVKRVKTSLIGAGFQVWMDIDGMQGHGSTLEAMAHAVENSSHVVVALSPGYKESPNCRLESEYALQRKKRVIPILVHPDYRPDGWLGIVLGAKLYHDVTGSKFENNIRNLIKDLRGGPTLAPVSVPTSVPMSMPMSVPMSVPMSMSSPLHVSPHEAKLSLSSPSPSPRQANPSDSQVLSELRGLSQQQAELRQEVAELKLILQEVLIRLKSADVSR